MAKNVNLKSSKQSKKKRPGVHSKNASRSQSSYKALYRGQGK